MACRYFLGDKELKGEALTSYMKNLPHQEKLKVAPEIAKDSYSRLSWTPGEAQAARYDLSKSVENINWSPSVIPDRTIVKIKTPDNKNISLQLKDGIVEEGQRANQFVGKPLSDVVGKEMANKILSEIKGDLSGEGLKIGGEGMKGFYDQILPKALEKIGKEHGVKVKQGETGEGKVKVYRHDALSNQFNTKAEAESWINRTFTPETAKNYKIVESKSPIHYIDIPQSLRDAAMHKGFPLFSKGGHMLMPVDHEPDFGDK